MNTSSMLEGRRYNLGINTLFFKYDHWNNVILKCFKNRLFEIINEQLLVIFLASKEDETDENYESDLKVLLNFQLNTYYAK